MNKEEAQKRNLLRFIHAQDGGGIYDGTSTYAEALQEVKAGHKRSHWIWYVFPQMKGLGRSEISKFYGINGREEAKAYIEHPVLRERLVEITGKVSEFLLLCCDRYTLEDTVVTAAEACTLVFIKMLVLLCLDKAYFQILSSNPVDSLEDFFWVELYG